MKKNIANQITFGRIILSVIIIVLLIFPLDTIGVNLPKFIANGIYMDSKYIISGVLFIIAAITDYVDGRIARKHNLVTDLGKIMDAIADKVLVNSVLIVLSAQGFIHPIITIVVIMRDVITNSFKTLAASNGEVLGAIKLAKYKTACLMAGILLTLFYNLPFELIGLNVAGYLLIVAAILSIASGVQYYNMVKKFFK